MKYAVVIVNWNGADDTVACLASFMRGSVDAVPVVVDNGSTDASLARIADGLDALGIAPWRVAGRAGLAPVAAGAAHEPIAESGAAAVAGAPSWRAALVDVGENLGFAAGCNVGLRLAQAAGLAVTVFLNNDTVVEPGALDRLVQRLGAGSDCFACVPMITVLATGRIWNCGGEVWRIGLRRYHLAGRPRAEGAVHGEIHCSFFTGCCVAVRTGAFAARGGFSERFFFGEEDFELALWMKERGLGAICVTSAVVAHKVSASFSAAAGPRQNAKVCLYYLNRFIHMRLRFGDMLWRLWLAAYLPYVAVLLWKGGGWRAAELAGVLRRLVGRARVMDGVTRADFEAVMSGSWPAA